MKRIPSGVLGLDRLLEGGFPENSVVLVSGPPGCGKTVLGLQFLYRGCTKYNEPGVLIQSEEFDKTLFWYEQMLGWKLAAAQEKGRLAILGLKPKDYDKFTPTKLAGEMLGRLKKIIAPMDAKRLVFDSISPLRGLMEKSEYRRSLYELIEFIKENELTTIFVCNEGETDVERHLCDGAINIRHREDKTGKISRELSVTKMIATSFPPAWYPCTVNAKLGFSVRPFL